MRACMGAGLVKGEAFAVDASVMEADASRYHAKAPDNTTVNRSSPLKATGRLLANLEIADATTPRKDCGAKTYCAAKMADQINVVPTTAPRRFQPANLGPITLLRAFRLKTSLL